MTDLSNYRPTIDGYDYPAKDYALVNAMGSRADPFGASGLIQNLSLPPFTVGASAATLTVKTRDGSTPSSDSPISVAMRSATVANGDYEQILITAALTMTITSGATLGTVNGAGSWLYVYLINNAGALELAVSSRYFGEHGIVSTTIMNSSADDYNTMYSTAARSSVAYRYIGRQYSAQTTAGTWAATPTNTELGQIRALPPTQFKLINGKITRSVGSSALTLAVKTLAGTDPTPSDPVEIVFPTIASAVQDGGYVRRFITAALSLVISSGSTLGHTSAVGSPVYAYLGDDAGTVVLGASTKYFGSASVQSSTAEGGAGAADSAAVMYSTAAKTSIVWSCVDRWKSTQTTAGTWAAVTGEVQLYPFPYKPPKITKVTATGAFVKDWDTLWLKLYVKGGGSGGAGSNSSLNDGGGGGEGEEGWRTLDQSLVPASLTVTIGAGTAGIGAGTNSNSTTAGTSSIGSLITAVGGSAATAGPAGGFGGGGGNGGTGGDYYMAGAFGCQGTLDDLSKAIPPNGGGKGGGLAFGNAVANSGAGGGGGSSATAAGAGAAGVAVIEEHYNEGV